MCRMRKQIQEEDQDVVGSDETIEEAEPEPEPEPVKPKRKCTKQPK